MKIHEYQAKNLFSQYGISVPVGNHGKDGEELVRMGDKLGYPLIAKVQIQAGGRGKAGGVQKISSAVQLQHWAQQFLGKMFVTAQTGPVGLKVSRILLEKPIAIVAEFYCALLIDRRTQTVTLVVSRSGGMDIETVAQEDPDQILRIPLEGGGLGWDRGVTETCRRALLLPEQLEESLHDLGQSLCRLFWESDASLVEINPLVLTTEQTLVALDAKMTLDDNAQFRHPQWEDWRDLDEEDRDEIEASHYGLSYVSLDGNIGCMVNGAGLAMATMDIIHLHGGKPANFLDVGGGATVEKVTKAFELMLRNPRLKVVWVNIFGGIMRCDVIAQGIIQAIGCVHLTLPLVVRLEGANKDEGRQILERSGYPIQFFETMDSAALAVVQCVEG